MQNAGSLLDLIVLMAAAVVVLAGLAAAMGPPKPRFARKRFLTAAETRVLELLEVALPQHRIMAQVAMGALLRADERNRKRTYAVRDRFSQKIVDFAIVSRDTAEVIALVELDDSTHSVLKDAKRDAMTASAGYRTIRIPGRPRPTLASIRGAVADFAPIPPHDVSCQASAWPDGNLRRFSQGLRE